MKNIKRNTFKSLSICLLALSLFACGQQDITGGDLREGESNDATINYTFGTPDGFTVTAVDMGVQIYYKPNPEVDHYILYVGSDAELTEIDDIESPIDVGAANSIRILPDNDLAGQTFFFAVKAVSPDGEEAPLTAVKSVTIEDLEGVLVRFKAKLETCVQQRSKFIFRNGEMKLYFNEGGTELPGERHSRCGINGTRLTLQQLNASGSVIDGAPTYYFPGSSSSPWSATGVGDSIDLSTATSSGPFAGLVDGESIIVSRNGEFKKSCEGVSLSHVFGRIETDGDEVPNIIDLDGRNCATNNWFTYLENGRDSEYNFELSFQTTTP